MSSAEFRVEQDESGAPDIERVDTDTWQMWAIALLPLAGLPLNLIPGSNTPLITASGNPAATPVLVLNIVLSVALIAVEVVLAVSDRRELLRRGVVRPMHPAWAILDIVYVIGRSVVVRRRVRGSLLPLWTWILTTVVTDVLLNLLP